MVVEDRITQAYPLVAIEARRFKTLPRGVSVDDLESVGGESLLEASANHSPDRGPWLRFAKFWVRHAMRNYVSKARVKAKRLTDLEVETDDGDRLPRADPRALDPAERASARESIAKRNNGSMMSLATVKGSLPRPAEVAEKVAVLREAMFGAVSASDIESVMSQVLKQAKGGDLRAARLLFDYLQPGRSGVTVQQVVINGGDV